MRQTFAHLEPDYLHDYEKGGGGNGMMMMMYMMQQQREQEKAEAIRQENQRKADQKAADDKAAAEKQDKITKSGSRVTGAYNSTLDQARRELAAQGYSGAALDKLVGDFQAKLDTTKAGLPEIVDNASDYFNTSGLEGITNLANTGFRTDLNKQLDPFIGEGFAKKSFADTADDAFINAILDEQYGTTKSALDRALARGTINDMGYQTGLSELSKQKAAGSGKAQGLGLGVLGGYRTQLESEASGIRGRADKAKYGDVFDVTGAQGSINDLTSSLSGKLEGDIYNAIGGMDFFDVDKLIGKAGTGGGVMGSSPAAGTGAGTGTPTLLSPLDTRAVDEDEEKKQGVF